jgi:drug/metabolite transporter (DMT)-like permease
MNLGYFFALLATISFALSAFPYTFLHQYATTTVVTFWRLLIATVLISIIAIIINANQFFTIFSSNYSSVWLWVGLSGIITFLIGDFLIFESYSVLGPAKGSLLTALSPAMALVFGIALLGDNINFLGVLGIAITIAGVILVNIGGSKVPTNTSNKLQTNKAILYGVLGASCLGIGIALSKKGSIVAATANLPITPIHITFIRIAAPLIIYAIICLLFFKKQSFFSILHNRQGLKLLVYGAIVNPTTGILFSMYSIATIDVAIAQTIFSISPLIALAINIFYYKQKATTQSIAGALVAIAGVLLLIFRDNF